MPYHLPFQLIVKYGDYFPSFMGQKTKFTIFLVRFQKLYILCLKNTGKIFIITTPLMSFHIDGQILDYPLPGSFVGFCFLDLDDLYSYKRFSLNSLTFFPLGKLFSSG